MATPRQIIVDNVLRNLPVGLMIIDPQGRVMTVSPSALTILGYSGKEAVGRNWEELIGSREENHAILHVIHDVFRHEKVGLHIEVPYISALGERRKLGLTSSYLGNKGQMIGIMVIFDDITELYQAREHENQILRERTRLQHDMIESLNNLALSVAHQIRNPLMAIGGFANKLSKYLKENELSTRYPEIIYEEAKRLEDIVTAVVRLSSLPRMRLSRTSLKEVIQNAVAEAAGQAAKLGKHVEWDLRLEDFEIAADPQLLELALKEIFLNALEFGREDGIVIQVESSRNDYAHIQITDNGPGIAAASKPFIFDPFYTTKTRGSGLGLTIARKIIFEHNGQLLLRSSSKKGATFSIVLREMVPRHLVSDYYGGRTMNVQELLAKARELGIDVLGLNKLDAVRKIQAAEGNNPCFGYGIFDRCGQENCCFRADCINIKLIDDQCKIVYCGQ